MFSGLITRQLSQPSGLIGSLILAPLWNRRNAALNDLAFEQLQLLEDDRVLEVGFGGGYLLRRLGGVLKSGSLAGVDASPTMVKAGEKRFSSLIRTRKLELHCARAEAMPFAEGYFTKACSVNSIFYWQDARLALEELSRVLAGGGLLVLCFTSKESLSERGLTGPGITAYEASEVERMLAEADFCEITTLRAKDRHRNYLCVRGIKHLGVPAE